MAYPNNIQHLLDKYWEGETDQQEEITLREYFQSLETPTPESVYFQMLRQEGEKVSDFVPARKVKLEPVPRWKNVLRYAAIGLVLTLAGFLTRDIIMQQQDGQLSSQKLEDSFENPEEAYAEAREALLLLAEKLNTTQTKAANKVSKIEPYTEIIK